MKNKLDKILFDNIDQTRLIYKKIELFGRLLTDTIKQNNLCQNKFENLSQNNMQLKETLAEIEIRNTLKLNRE